MRATPLADTHSVLPGPSPPTDRAEVAAPPHVTLGVGFSQPDGRPTQPVVGTRPDGTPPSSTPRPIAAASSTARHIADTPKPQVAAS
jgi:hypothetical protein